MCVTLHGSRTFIHDVRLIDRLFSLCTTAPPPNEEFCPLAEFTPPTGYEPKLLDDFHYSETTEIFFQEQSGDKDAVHSYLCDAELDDETIGKALSSPLCSFRSEKNQRTEDKLIALLKKVCCQILLERQKEQILADFRAEIHKH